MSKPPENLAWWFVGLGEAFARRAGIPVADFWDFATKAREPPPDLLEALRDAFAPLTSSHVPSTLDDMPSTEVSSNALRSQAQLTDEVRGHRFVKAMIKRGLTFAEVADALGAELGRKIPRSSLLSWVKPKGDVAARGIPEDAAEALRSLYGVPVTAWRRVIPKS
jgi:hypothetical protein